MKKRVLIIKRVQNLLNTTFLLVILAIVTCELFANYYSTFFDISVTFKGTTIDSSFFRPYFKLFIRCENNLIETHSSTASSTTTNIHTEETFIDHHRLLLLKFILCLFAILTKQGDLNTQW